jgi:hypothetical protein
VEKNFNFNQRSGVAILLSLVRINIYNSSVSDPYPHSICLLDPDPDPAADEISSKSQKINII